MHVMTPQVCGLWTTFQFFHQAQKVIRSREQAAATLQRLAHLIQTGRTGKDSPWHAKELQHADQALASSGQLPAVGEQEGLRIAHISS
jgi:hypothetical protein